MEKAQYIKAKKIEMFAQAAASTVAVKFDNLAKEDVKITDEIGVIEVFNYEYGDTPVKRWTNGSKVTAEITFQTEHKHWLKEIFGYKTFAGTSATDWKAGTIATKAEVKCMEPIEIWLYPHFEDCATATNFVSTNTNPLAFKITVFPPSVLEWVFSADAESKHTFTFDGTVDSNGVIMQHGSGLTPPTLP